MGISDISRKPLNRFRLFVGAHRAGDEDVIRHGALVRNVTPGSSGRTWPHTGSCYSIDSAPKRKGRKSGRKGICRKKRA